MLSWLNLFSDLYMSFFIYDMFEHFFYPFLALAVLVTVPCLIHFIFKR